MDSLQYYYRTLENLSPAPTINCHSPCLTPATATWEHLLPHHRCFLINAARIAHHYHHHHHSTSYSAASRRLPLSTVRPRPPPASLHTWAPLRPRRRQQLRQPSQTIPCCTDSTLRLTGEHPSPSTTSSRSLNNSLYSARLAPSLVRRPPGSTSFFQESQSILTPNVHTPFAECLAIYALIVYVGAAPAARSSCLFCAKPSSINYICLVLESAVLLINTFAA